MNRPPDERPPKPSTSNNKVSTNFCNLQFLDKGSNSRFKGKYQGNLQNSRESIARVDKNMRMGLKMTAPTF